MRDWLQKQTALVGKYAGLFHISIAPWYPRREDALRANILVILPCKKEQTAIPMPLAHALIPPALHAQLHHWTRQVQRNNKLSQCIYERNCSTSESMLLTGISLIFWFSWQGFDQLFSSAELKIIMKYSVLAVTCHIGDGRTTSQEDAPTLISVYIYRWKGTSDSACSSQLPQWEELRCPRYSVPTVELISVVCTKWAERN